MEYLLQRICWNRYYWTEPSGEQYRLEDSYVGENGYGFEEWNFNLSDTFSGKIYGYLYYENIQDGTTIYFFTINPRHERMLVGVYVNAHPVSRKEKKEFKEEFVKSEIFKRRAKELVTLGISSISSLEEANGILEKFADEVKVWVFPEDVIILEKPVKLIPEIIGFRNPVHLNRYKNPVMLRDPIDLPQSSIVKAEIERKDSSLLSETPLSREISAHSLMISRRHNILSNNFKAWLEKRGAQDIVQEQNQIDLTCDFKEKSYLFELKTCYSTNSLQFSLREALGQVLFYQFYPNRKGKDNLGIVLEKTPSMEDINWFKKLNENGLDIELYWNEGSESDFKSACITDHGLTGDQIENHPFRSGLRIKGLGP